MTSSYQFNRPIDTNNMMEKLAMSDGVDNKKREAISCKNGSRLPKNARRSKTPAERLGHGNRPPSLKSAERAQDID